jgi:predicted enzyme related to lactoylglutathione lyase
MIIFGYYGTDKQGKLYSDIIYSLDDKGLFLLSYHLKNNTLLGLRTAIYKVGDIKKAAEWYSKAFETNPYFNESYYVGFNIGGYELGLQPEENANNNKVESVVPYWGVENIQEVYDRLIGLGATENEKPYNVGEEIMTATVKDPFGNIIGLIYNPHFKI